MGLIWLDNPVTTSAYAWYLQRTDGVAIGFTSHDQDVWIDGFQYRSAPGMVPSAISLTDSLEIDSVDIEGVLSSNAISSADILTGRWNGAKLEISLINWEAPDSPALHLITGEFGEIVQSGESFRVEVLGATSFLDGAVAPLTSPTCRARFGDKHCKQSLHQHQAIHPVTAVFDDGIEFAGLAGTADDYGFGELRWMNGANTGLVFAVISGTGNIVRLADQPANPVEPGDKAQLTRGCNKNFATCRDRFANAINFRGEPFLPGNDLLTRYPGA